MFPSLSEEAQRAAALEVYRAASASPFYAEKYAGLPDPSGEGAWAGVPPLARQEVYENAYPHSQRMLTVPLGGMIVTSTGGSTGIARFTALLHGEWDAAVGMQAAALENIGVRPVDRVANLFVAGHLWPSFLGVHDSLRRIGALHLPISANIPPEEIGRLCAQLDPTVMLSLPTLFVLLADVALKEGVRFPSLRLVGYAGEQMSEQAERHVRKGLGVEEVRAVGYTSADAGLMGYQCPRCGFGTYHEPSSFQLLEAVNPDTGRPVAPGEQGEILVTNLVRRAMPLVRYRIGDLATFTGEPCPCGDPNRLFRLAGRTGDDFKIGGAYISMRVFDESIEGCPIPLSLNYCVELEDFENTMVLRLTVEAADPAGARAAAGPLRDAVCRAAPHIGACVEKGYIRDFEVRFADLGSLPRSPITGKVKRLNDRRAVRETPA